jgi:hypothetical protein
VGDPLSVSRLEILVLNSIILGIMRRHIANYFLCNLGMHKWTNWSDPISGEKAVAILIATGESIKEQVMLQERRCMRCNKAEYKHVKIKQ